MPWQNAKANTKYLSKNHLPPSALPHKKQEDEEK
jgi:hypothetical protein